MLPQKNTLVQNNHLWFHTVTSKKMVHSYYCLKYLALILQSTKNTAVLHNWYCSHQTMQLCAAFNQHQLWHSNTLNRTYGFGNRISNPHSTQWLTRPIEKQILPNYIIVYFRMCIFWYFFLIDFFFLLKTNFTQNCYVTPLHTFHLHSKYLTLWLGSVTIVTILLQYGYFKLVWKKKKLQW